MVSVIVCTIRQNFLDNVFQNYESQTWPDKELIIILNKDDMDINIWRDKARNYQNVSVYQLPETSTLGECLNFGVEKSKYDYIAKFDDDDYYSPFYLSKSMEIFHDPDVSLTGKNFFYVYFENEKLLVEHKRHPRVSGGTIIFKKDIFKKVKFPERNKGEDAIFVRNCIENGFKFCPADKFNYVCIRKNNLDHHTWKITQETLMKKKKSKIIAYTDDFKQFVQQN
ncbi:glycosyltransferase [Metabacillus fastidiosus]|uniref:glycosyltransferase n=1 Tax=Metabacillus fastidiosus TaxID=1458 RepID=UPI003D2E3FA9